MINLVQIKKISCILLLGLISLLCCNNPKELTTIMIETDKEIFNPLLEPGVTGNVSVVGFYSDGSKEIISPYNLSLNAETKVSSGNVEVISITENRVIPGEGGVGTIKAVVIDGDKTITATKDIVVRPFYRDYHQTLILKLFMGMEGDPVQRLVNEPLFQREHDVICTFAEALEVIKKVDHLTCQVPKIIYLVGWQKGGHDHLFPAWDEVNPLLKRDEDTSALESLRWLIREAKQYNTSVSLHINMVDAYKHSPLWEEYLKRDVIAKDRFGNIRSAGIAIKGDSMYHVIYPLEWETGLTQRRIDGLIDMIPELKELQTIHVDVFIAQREDGSPISPWHAKPENGGLTIDKYVETQRNIFKYWREKGFDVTGEGILWAHPPGEGFYGLQPMAWWYPNDIRLQMRIPENLTARGRTSRTDQGDYRFGSSMHGEELFLKDQEYLPGFLDMFCKSTLPWLYLGQHSRVAFIDEVLYYSEGIRAGEEKGKKIVRKGDYVLRENDDLFVEAVWKEKEIIAYSETGYENKIWQMPETWKDVKAVDISQITIEGTKLIKENVVVRNQTLTLTLEKMTGVSIIPSKK